MKDNNFLLNLKVSIFKLLPNKFKMLDNDGKVLDEDFLKKLLKERKKLKISIRKGKYDIIECTNEDLLTDKIIKKILNNNYKINNNTPDKIKNNLDYILLALNNNDLNCINYTNCLDLISKEMIIDIINSGYIINSNTPIEIKNCEEYRKIFFDKHVNDEDIISEFLKSLELITKEELVYIINNFSNFHKIIINKKIYNNIDNLKILIENKDTKYIDFVDLDVLIKLPIEYIYLAIDYNYNINFKTPKLLLNNKKILNYVLEHIKNNNNSKNRFLPLFLKKEFCDYEIMNLCLKKCTNDKISIDGIKEYLLKISKGKYNNFDDLLNDNENIKKLIYDYVEFVIIREASYYIDIEELYYCDENNFFQDGVYDFESEEVDEYLLKKIMALLSISKIKGMNIELRQICKIDLELVKKYKTKIYDNLSKHRLFRNNNESKNSLIEMIGVFGVFENDKNIATNNLNILKDLINKVPNRFSKIEYNMLLMLNKDIKDFFKEVDGYIYVKREGCAVPSLLNKYKDYFDEILFENDFHFLKKLIPTGRTGSELNKFLKNNYQAVPRIYYELDFTKKIDMDVISNIILKSDIKGVLTQKSLLRIFDGLEQVYDSDFFDFLVRNWNLILHDISNQRKLLKIQADFKKITKRYNNYDEISWDYAVQSVNNVRFFNVHFGNETLAEEIENAGVKEQDAFDYYQKIYNQGKKIRQTTLPNYYKEFEFMYNNELVRFRARRLRKDDPLAMLVGEVNYTNCCQGYDKTGEDCNLHSVVNENGGIFITEIKINNEWKLLTESWDWTNENVYCHDNIETIDALKYYNIELHDIIINIYKEHAKDIIKESSNKVNEFKKKLKQDNILTDEEINNFVERQTIKLVTVGKEFNIINIRNYFQDIYNNARGPKGYGKYKNRDSKIQYIIEGNLEDVIDEDINYKEIPIYEEQREIKFEKNDNISSFTLRKLYDIGFNNKDYNFITNENYPVIFNKEQLKEYYNTNTINVIKGEDWIIFFEINNFETIILDIIIDKEKINTVLLNEVKESINKISKNKVKMNYNLKDFYLMDYLIDNKDNINFSLLECESHRK